MTSELKAVIKKLENLDWERIYRGHYGYWKYRGTNRYVDIDLPYIDFYIYSNEEKCCGYLTAAELDLFNKLVQLLVQEKSEEK